MNEDKLNLVIPKSSPSRGSEQGGFWSELKRRKVMRVAITYGVIFANCLLLVESVSATGGEIKRSLILESEVLGKAVPFSLYLPQGYNSEKKGYPVIYLLHGGGGDETRWLDNSDVGEQMDQLISAQILVPSIVVMPGAGPSRFINNHDNSVPFEDFFIDEFIPFIETEYGGIPGKRSRVLMGSSMGGYGSIVLAMRHPDKFAAAISFMGSFCEDERVLQMTVEGWNRSTRGPVYGLNLSPEERFTQHYRNHDPCHILKDGNHELLKTVKWYLDCGDDDFRIHGNIMLFQRMKELELPVEFRSRNGAHSMNYVQGGLNEALRFTASLWSK